LKHRCSPKTGRGERVGNGGKIGHITAGFPRKRTSGHAWAIAVPFKGTQPI
jgi:hypothetical protein